MAKERYIAAANPILSYYFHPDHLGSSSYMSGNGGSILQHMEYLPFGEAMMDEHINSYCYPYTFSSVTDSWKHYAFQNRA